jgi:hypothetical protein
MVMPLQLELLAIDRVADVDLAKPVDISGNPARQGQRAVILGDEDRKFRPLCPHINDLLLEDVHVEIRARRG